MRHLPAFLFFVAIACAAFAYWGLETTRGRRTFDEMAGIIPVGVGAVGVVLVVVAVALWVWQRVKAG